MYSFKLLLTVVDLDYWLYPARTSCQVLLPLNEYNTRLVFCINKIFLETDSMLLLLLNNQTEKENFHMKFEIRQIRIIEMKSIEIITKFMRMEWLTMKREQTTSIWTYHSGSFGVLEKTSDTLGQYWPVSCPFCVLWSLFIRNNKLVW